MEQKNKVIDVTGTELTPGDPQNCLGGDNHPEHPLCCDECDYYLACFPEWDARRGEGEKMFLTKFVRKDGKPDEDYFYNTAEEALHHASLFVEDESNLYKKIVASDERKNTVLQLLVFGEDGKAVSFKEGDVVRLKPEFSSEGERRYIFTVRNINDRTMRLIISCLNSGLSLGSSEAVGVEMVSKVGTTMQEILESASQTSG